MAKLWGGRFSKNTNELVDAFNASIDLINVYITKISAAALLTLTRWQNAASFRQKTGKNCCWFEDILADIEAGNCFGALEDIHMNVEARLTERIGQAGARLHTARSRNLSCAICICI